MRGNEAGIQSAAQATVLMTAFHYPPCHGSSGVQRTLSFSRYLPENGWRPVVLTAATRAYQTVSVELVGAESPEARIVRAAAWDAAKHFSILGRYPQWLARPDRWANWIAPAVMRGLWECRGQRVNALWSTFPIASAHVIACLLKRLTGLPWIADFRDPMWEGDYPRRATLRRSAQRIESRAVCAADRVVLTTEGACELFKRRYPDVPRSKFAIIENGYDEQSFSGRHIAERQDQRDSKVIRIVHSGTLYPSERDPRGFFQALAELRGAGFVDASRLRVVLRATGHDREIAGLVAQFGIGDLVVLEAAVGYSAAIEEMCTSDVLLLLQADNCDRQVPAKVYEYLRAGRPILALVGPNGDTNKLIGNLDWVVSAPLDNPSMIAAALRRICDRRWLSSRRVDWRYVGRFDRRAQTGQLARLLNEVSRLRLARCMEP